MRSFKILAATAVLLGLVNISLVSAAARPENCAALAQLKLSRVHIDVAELVATGSVTKPLQEAGLTARTAAYCRVQATLNPRPESSIKFELWMPVGKAWNGKFEQIGNGGFAGTVPARYMFPALQAGYAVAGTDDGHTGADFADARWALHQPQKIVDFGWRAIAETTVASKTILQAFKQTPPAKSYFYGCSDGGREALMMAQRFPGYFDGVVAGAAATAMTRLFTGGAVRGARLLKSGVTLSPGKLALLQSRALDSCGHGGRYLKDPQNCRVELDALKCSGVDNDSCLTEAQIAAAKTIYQDLNDPASGRPLYGFLPGAEAVKGGWNDWITGANGDFKSAGLAITWNYLAFMVKDDPNLNLADVSADDLKRGELEVGAQIDADEPDLAAFRARGGKVLQYHGWNDPAVAPGYALEYRDRLIAKLGSVADFYRLYMVPGMLHCGGGDAPTRVDWQASLSAWVERGIEPQTLTAFDGKGDSQALTPVGQ